MCALICACMCDYDTDAGYSDLGCAADAPACFPSFTTPCLEIGGGYRAMGMSNIGYNSVRVRASAVAVV